MHSYSIRVFLNQQKMSTQITSKLPPKTYTQDEAFEASQAYFKGDDLAARVWINKYALKDSEGTFSLARMANSSPL